MSLPSLRLPSSLDFVCELPIDAIEKHPDNDRVRGSDRDDSPAYVRAVDLLREEGTLFVRVGVLGEDPPSVIAYADWEILRAHKSMGRTTVTVHGTRFRSEEALNTVFHVHAGPGAQTEWHWSVYAVLLLERERAKAVGRRQAGVKADGPEAGEARMLVSREMGRSKDTITAMERLVKLARKENPTAPAASSIARELSKPKASARALYAALERKGAQHKKSPPLPATSQPSSATEVDANSVREPTSDAAAPSPSERAPEFEQVQAPAPMVSAVTGRVIDAAASPRQNDDHERRSRAGQVEQLSHLATSLNAQLTELDASLAEKGPSPALESVLRDLMRALDAVGHATTCLRARLALVQASSDLHHQAA